MRSIKEKALAGFKNGVERKQTAVKINQGQFLFLVLATENNDEVY